MSNDRARLRNLQVTHREALALLASLELSPFEDEALKQKLLNVVYRDDGPTGHRRHSQRRGVSHHRR